MNLNERMHQVEEMLAEALAKMDNQSIDIAIIKQEVNKLRTGQLTLMQAYFRQSDTLEHLLIKTTKTDERVTSLEAKVDSLDQKVDSLDQKVDSLDQKVDSLDQKVDSLDQKVDSLDQKVDSLDQKVDSLDQKVDSLDQKVDSLDQKVDTWMGSVNGNIAFLIEKAAKTDDKMDEMARLLHVLVDRSK